MWNGKVKYSIMAKVRITSLLIPKFLLRSVLVLFLKQWRDIVEIFKAILFGRQVWENPRAFVYISEVFDLNGKVFFWWMILLIDWVGDQMNEQKPTKPRRSARNFQFTKCLGVFLWKLFSFWFFSNEFLLKNCVLLFFYWILNWCLDSMLFISLICFHSLSCL